MGHSFAGLMVAIVCMYYPEKCCNEETLQIKHPVQHATYRWCCDMCNLTNLPFHRKHSSEQYLYIIILIPLRMFHACFLHHTTSGSLPFGLLPTVLGRI